MPMPIEQKDINISEVKDSKTESYVETVDTPEDFYAKLKINNISDLQSGSVNIKRDQQKYIFEIRGQDSFCVYGEQKFQDFVKYFYEQQKGAEKNILVEIDGLKLSVLSGTDPLLKKQAEKQQNHLDNATNIENIKSRANMLYDFYDAQLDESKWNAFLLNPKFTKQEKAAWKINKVEAKNRLRTIERIQKDIENMEQ